MIRNESVLFEPLEPRLLLNGAPVLDNGLVAHWAFDDGAGTTAVDSSANSNDGTLVNDPTWVNGVYGDALSFDGADDYVDYGDVLNDTTFPLTVSTWVYRRGADEVTLFSSVLKNRLLSITAGLFTPLSDPIVTTPIVTYLPQASRRDVVLRTIGVAIGGPKMRRILLLACFAILAIAAIVAFAADTDPRGVADRAEINGVTPTATQPPPTATQPMPTQPSGPTPSPPPS